MLQPISKDLYRSAQVAKRLLADVQIADHVIRETVYNETISTEVHGRVADERFCRGGLVIERGQKYYLVASRFPGYFYIVCEDGGGGWLCSSSNKRAWPRLVERVREHCGRRYALLLNEAYH